MGILWKEENPGCQNVRDALEANPEVASLSPKQQEHLASCPDCQVAADERLMSRLLFRDVTPLVSPDAWFPARVMAAIAARESELRERLETWAVLPRFAARITWVSALALLLVGTWVYQSPRFARNSAKQPGVESLFDTPQPAASDDVLLSAERGND